MTSFVWMICYNHLRIAFWLGVNQEYNLLLETLAIVDTASCTSAPTAALTMAMARLSFEEHPKDALHVMLFDQVANSR